MSARNRHRPWFRPWPFARYAAAVDATHDRYVPVIVGGGVFEGAWGLQVAWDPIEEPSLPIGEYLARLYARAADSPAAYAMMLAPPTCIDSPWREWARRELIRRFCEKYRREMLMAFSIGLPRDL